MLKTIESIEKKYQNKNILIVSHGDPLWLLEGLMKGLNNEEMLGSRKKMIKKGELKKLEFKKFPYNKKGELDFHRPFVDEIEFYCPCCQKEKMQRIKEVGDVWFDSGAMPFAQVHWPFSQSQKAKLKSKTKPPNYFLQILSVRAWIRQGMVYTLLAFLYCWDFQHPIKMS